MIFDQLIASGSRFGRLRKQIISLDSALFYTEMQPPFQVPVFLINHVYMDDGDNIWFTVRKKNLCVLLPTGQELPVQLKFFKKGMPYWINVTGTAIFSDDLSAIDNFITQHEAENQVAVKVAIRTAKQINIFN